MNITHTLKSVSSKKFEWSSIDLSMMQKDFLAPEVDERDLGLTPIMLWLSVALDACTVSI